MHSTPPRGGRPSYPPARPSQPPVPLSPPATRSAHVSGPPSLGGAPGTGGLPRRGQGKARLLRVLVVALFGGLTLLGLAGFVTVVGAAILYSDGLPEPTELEAIVFPEDTVIYSRDGKLLARLTSGGERRRVIDWEDVPPILADSVTAVEDKTFWANTGIDPLGIASAALDTLTGDARGGSTITQQLVRQKLLPEAVMQESTRLGERKVKELIQSIRVTDAYRGREGKQAILTAYLNQNFYGNNSYGVAAAARSYFGITDLDELSPAQAATLAAIPQAPSAYDLVRNAVETDDGTLIVPPDSAIVRRRNLVLDLLAEDATRRELTGSTYSREDFLAAKGEPLEVRAQQGQSRWLAPHFIWYVREELRQRLCGGAETCDPLERGGMRVTTTLDWGIQQSGEKWIAAAALVPHRANPAAAAEALGVPYAAWMQRLRGQNVWNGALSAIDYERGEIIAYVGSAGYYERRKVSRKMQPQFDVLSSGWRQPGSAFKPFVYATGIDEESLTAATLLMDVTTDFGGYAPTDFSSLERGPVRVRNALQFSLNIPAVKALAIVGENDVFERSQQFGMDFQRRRPTAGLSMALGTLEVHPLDLNHAYGTLANGGRDVGLTSILEVTSDGQDVLPPHDPGRGEPAVSEQAAGIVTDILAGNTDPTVNPIWAAHAVTDRRGRRRPATFKTGTTNDAKDLNAYGYIAPPSAQGRKKGEYALSVGVWAGNSDASAVTTVANPVFSLDVAAPIWDAFLTEVTRTWEIRDFRRPDGLTTARVDTFTGYEPSEWSRRQVNELFLRGTTPGKDPYLAGVEVVRGADDVWYLWEDGCDGRPRTRGYLDLAEAESAYPSWNEAVRGWIRRARRGTGQGANVSGTKRTYTAYFYEPYFQPYGQTWGGPFSPTRSCHGAPAESPSAEPSASASPSLEPSGPPEPTVEPTEPPEPTEAPTPEPKPTKKPKPPDATPELTDGPTDAPEPTDVPSATPEAAAAAADEGAAAGAEEGAEAPAESPGG